MKPLSNEIKREIEKADKIILVEENVTGQLSRLIREKTGIVIKNRILKYDGRPFYCDKLKEEILKVR
jgi:2-oxoglutarate ferredoxin oxidoreductase subunit alpha